MKHIVYISGTRADYGLMSSVLSEIEKITDLDLTVIVTGMHIMPKFGENINEIKKDKHKIEIIKTIYKKDDLTATPKFLGSFLKKLTDKLKKLKPCLVLLLGDRAEMLAGAIAGLYLNIPIAHISGGDTTGHVDDAIRNSITKLSHIHFPLTKRSAKKIIEMGEKPSRVFVVGSTSLDNIKSKRFLDKQTLLGKYNIKSPFIILIQHPVITEIDQADTQVKKTLDAIIGLNIPSIVIYPNADAGGRKIIKAIKKYEKYPQIKIFSNIAYNDFLDLYKHAAAILGNSSSAIIESVSFGIPAINIGTRQEGREKAENVIDVDYSTDEITKALKKALYDKKFKEKCYKAQSPYCEDNSGKKIANILHRLKFGKYLLNKNNDCKLKPNFKKFNDYAPEDINFDFHIHTVQTDGESTAEEIIKQAKKLKLDSIAFTEHVRRDSDWYPDFKKEIGKLRKKEDIKILIGIEAKALNWEGTIDASKEIINDAEIIIGSVHSYPYSKNKMIPIKEIINLGEKKAAEIEFKASIGLLKNPQIDIIGHPLGMFMKTFNKFNKDDMVHILKESLKEGVAVEINTTYLRYLIDSNNFFKLLRKINPYVSFGSDAHNKDNIGRDANIIKKVLK